MDSENLLVDFSNIHRVLRCCKTWKKTFMPLHVVRHMSWRHVLNMTSYYIVLTSWTYYRVSVFPAAVQKAWSSSTRGSTADQKKVIFHHWSSYGALTFLLTQTLKAGTCNRDGVGFWFRRKHMEQGKCQSRIIERKSVFQDSFREVDNDCATSLLNGTWTSFDFLFGTACWS